jgi:hypothetical protein
LQRLHSAAWHGTLMPIATRTVFKQHFLARHSNRDTPGMVRLRSMTAQQKRALLQRFCLHHMGARSKRAALREWTSR